MEGKRFELGSVLSFSLPGIARPFMGEVVEISEQQSGRARARVRALEHVLGYTNQDQILYECGSLIWLTVAMPAEDYQSETVDSSSAVIADADSTAP